MSYLNRDQYEARARSAANRMYENSQIQTLTTDQHIALATVCSIRHEMHSNNQSSMYYTEHGKYRSWIELSNTINKLLTDAGLEKISGLEISEDQPSDQDTYMYDNDQLAELCDYDGDMSDEDSIRDAYHAYGIAMAHQRSESINTTIESYLRDIDDKHGTSYCPTGALRR